MPSLARIPLILLASSIAAGLGCDDAPTTPVDPGPGDCSSRAEVCNGQDDNCNDVVDEQPEAACTAANAIAACVEGVCRLTGCNPGFGDCNGSAADGCEAMLDATGRCPGGGCPTGSGDCDGVADNGCETALDTIANCGQCGVSCGAGTNADPSCTAGICGLSCHVGSGNCDGAAANGCETALDTAAACGACGATCGGGANATGVCLDAAGGTCGVSCNAGFGDCNTDASDGCEAPLDATGMCPGGGCPPSLGDCNTDPADGCETALNSAAHCGACGRMCAATANADGLCTDPATGACGATCHAGFGDCNMNPADGCEAALNTPAQCGSCSRVCPMVSGSDPVCLDPATGACGVMCRSGFGDCNTNPADGCEQALNAPAHCGGCNVACPLATAADPTCTDPTTGACGFTCHVGFGDCNTDASDGCEQPLDADRHCGACNMACSDADHGTGSCAGAMAGCSLACDDGWGDCNTDLSDGCELQLNDPAHCGACNQPCPARTNSVARCVDPSMVSCSYTCAAGFRDCNGDAADGCESVGSACPGDSLACDDDGGTGNTSRVEIAMSMGEVAVVVVDSYGMGGAFQLNIHETERGRCGDGRDNDGNGTQDCGDPACAPDPACCPTGNLMSALGASVASGTLTGASGNIGGCSAAGPEMTYTWVVPHTGGFIFDTEGSPTDTVISLREATCSGDNLGCDDDGGFGNTSRVEADLTGGDSIVVVVDSYGMGGAFSLNIHETERGRCGDGRDNDGNGTQDCGDPACATEPACCPTGNLMSALGASVASGTLTGASGNLGGCAGPGPEMTYSWVVPHTGGFIFDTEGSPTDTVISLREATCGGDNLGCDDDGGTGNTSRVEAQLTGGDTLVVVVDSYGMGGAFQLNIHETEAGRCGDGRDNDGNGTQDCGDPACAPDPACCPTGDLMSALGDAVASGTLSGPSGNLGGCAGPGPEQTYAWVVPHTGGFIFDTEDSPIDTVISLREATCSGDNLGCDDDGGTGNTSRVEADLTGGDSIVVIVDSYGTGGAFSLDIRETERGRCGDGRDNDGNGTQDCGDPACATEPACCPTGNLMSSLGMSVASGTLTGASGNLGGCSAAGPEMTYSWVAPHTGGFIFDTEGSPIDTVISLREATCGGDNLGCDDDGGTGNTSKVVIDLTGGDTLVVVVDSYGMGGAFSLNIHETERGRCGDGRDNDGNGTQDCGDPACAPDPACCPTGNLMSAMGPSVASGNLSGASGNIGGCSAAGPEMTYSWVVPHTGGFIFDTEGSPIDTVISLREATCSGDNLGCDDDGGTGNTSRVEANLTGGDFIVVVVDSYGMGGAFTLNIKETERGRCADGRDNDGNGTQDCGDPACATEPACCPTGTLMSALGPSVASGTLSGPSGNLGGCQGPGPEMTYSWIAPHSGSFIFDTEGSPIDTVLSLRSQICGAP